LANPSNGGNGRDSKESDDHGCFASRVLEHGRFS
jgi:hypothetical protein